MEKAFEFLKAPLLPEKPREKAIFIGSDFGQLVYPLQKAYVEEYHDLIDFAKIADHIGLAGRRSKEWYVRRLSLYQEYNIPCFPGGISFEIAYLQHQATPFFKRLKELGFSGVEISEDVIPPISHKERIALIKEAISIGLDVYTEVGRKYPDKPIDVQEAIDSIKADLDAGSKKVTVEAAETLAIMRGEADVDNLLRIVSEVGVENVVFESGPGPWPETTIWLIKTIGPDVNLENIDLEQCNVVYAFRFGVHRFVGYEFLTKKRGIVE